MNKEDIEPVANGSTFDGEKLSQITFTVHELAERDANNFWDGFHFAVRTLQDALAKITETVSTNADA